MISEFGFDYVRFPLDYRFWVKDGDWRKIDENAFKDIDQAVQWGRRYHLHVCLNFHRAPGYCINPPPEPSDLWGDSQTREVCAFHWATFAKRYKGISNREMSFDLVNEPSRVDNATYALFVRSMAEGIRSEDPQRLIIADGTEVGNKPVPEIIPLGVAQATRGYQPMEISHYQAAWFAESKSFSKPVWPMQKAGQFMDKAWLKRKFIEPWKRLESEGVGVFVGEWGCYHRTPHVITLHWMRDQLKLWKEAGWGWALWNFRGDFGPLDSNRADVAYEEYDGHQLDRKMMELLQAL
jgi:endoglucanase